MNPMENIWGILARRIYENNRQYAGLGELKRAIINAWLIDQKIIENLISSMDTRIFQIIKLNGEAIDY